MDHWNLQGALGLMKIACEVLFHRHPNRGNPHHPQMTEIPSLSLSLLSTTTVSPNISVASCLAVLMSNSVHVIAPNE